MLHLTVCRYGSNTKTRDENGIVDSFFLSSVVSLMAVYSSTDVWLGLGRVHGMCELANAWWWLRVCGLSDAG